MVNFVHDYPYDPIFPTCRILKFLVIIINCSIFLTPMIRIRGYIIRTIDQDSHGPTADRRIKLQDIKDPKDGPAEGMK